jgi:serine/threonine protein phosphatase PrpC
LYLSTTTSSTLHNPSGEDSGDSAWSSAAASHLGTVRETNEDAFLEDPARGLWVVADGMGGLAAGDIASRNTINALDRFEPCGDVASDVDWLDDSLTSVNRMLRQRQEWVRSGNMGSTVALLLAHGDLGVVMWAGDSRVYRYRGGELSLLTEDHSYVEELVRRGKVRREDADTHPAANIISRAVGVEDRLFVDLDYTRISPGDCFLICTDGLYRELTESRISACLDEPTPGEACDRLLDEALRAGAKDNVTLIVAKARATRTDIGRDRR